MSSTASSPVPNTNRARLVAIATYAPRGRLAAADVRSHWPAAGGPAGVRSVAVPDVDEDVTTMAVQVLDDLLHESPDTVVDAVLVATCSSPYAEHSAASEVVRALDLPRSTAVVDLAGSVRGGVTGLALAAGAVESGRWRTVAVVAADARRGELGSGVEVLGAGAAAVLVSSEGGVAVGSLATERHGVPTRWRPNGATALRSYDDTRYERDELVVPAVRAAVAGTGGASPVFLAGGYTDARSPSVIGAACGIESDVGDDGVAELGDLGTAGPLFSLAHCLERADPGTSGVVFAAEPGAGADALSLSIEVLIPIVTRRPAATAVDYVGYLQRTGVLATSGLEPIVPWAATPGAYRDDLLGALVGAECTRCGSVSIPPRPLCIDCGGDSLELRRVPRRGQVVTHNRQHVVAVSPEPAPVSVGVARLDGLAGERGGQVSAMFCDADAEIRVGAAVELVYRRLGVDDGLVKYGWKLRLQDDDRE